MLTGFLLEEDPLKAILEWLTEELMSLKPDCWGRRINRFNFYWNQAGKLIL